MKTTIKHCRRCGAYDNISVKKCSNCGNVYYVTRKPKKKNETGNRATWHRPLIPYAGKDYD